MSHKAQKGFTLIEIVIVITILGVIASLVYSLVIPKWRERTYYTRSLAELNTMGNALNLYVAKYNDYPPEEPRGIPAGIKEFIQSQQGNDKWPNAPYPDTVYDYENWPADEDRDLQQTFQISIRFCESGQDDLCKTRAKKYLSDHVDKKTLDEWDSSSSLYYCIKGSCRADQATDIDHPAFCINCGNKGSIF